MTYNVTSGTLSPTTPYCTYSFIDLLFSLLKIIIILLNVIILKFVVSYWLQFMTICKTPTTKWGLCEMVLSFCLSVCLFVCLFICHVKCVKKVKERIVLREIHLRTTGHHLSMGSHSVICYPTEVTAPPSPQPGRLVLNLSTP